jgi:hypothetical protein
MDDFIAKLPTRQTPSDYLEKLGVRPVGSSSEPSWQKIDLYELAQVSLDSLSDSLSYMSSWVAVCPSAHLPSSSSTNEAITEANKGSPIHHMREEAGIPLRCIWAQRFPSTTIRAERRSRAKPNPACHTRHQHSESKRRQHIVWVDMTVLFSVHRAGQAIEQTENTTSAPRMNIR